MPHAFIQVCLNWSTACTEPVLFEFCGIEDLFLTHSSIIIYWLIQSKWIKIPCYCNKQQTYVQIRLDQIIWPTPLIWWLGIFPAVILSFLMLFVSWDERNLYLMGGGLQKKFGYQSFTRVATFNQGRLKNRRRILTVHQTSAGGKSVNTDPLGKNSSVAPLWTICHLEVKGLRHAITAPN